MSRPSVPTMIRRQIEKDIRDGVLKPGQPIPTEAELGAQLGVGRSSVREALKVLERKGLIDVQPGRGRVVSELSSGWIESPITSFRSVSELLAASGYKTICQVLNTSVGIVTPEEMQVLGIEEGSSVIRLERTHLLDGAPIVFMQETVPVALIGSESLNEDWSKSLVAVMAKRGHKPVASRAGMKAVHLPKELSNKLPAAKGLDKESWLEITETNLDSFGQICLFSKVYLKGDLFTFTFIRTDDN